MRVVGVSMVRDESDIAAATINNLLAQGVEHVIVMDNGSSDGTRALLDTFDTGRVTVLDDNEVAYYQSKKITSLASMAACEFGARWVIPFDADEFWYSPFGSIHDALERVDHRGVHIVRAPVYDHVPTAGDPSGEPFRRMGWRRCDPNPLSKVACRACLPALIEQGNHGVAYGPPRVSEGDLVVRHFPYRSVAQMIRKARNGAQAYAATDLPDDVGQHWRDYGRLTDEQIGDVFRRWFWSPEPASQPDLTFDPAPWPASR